MAEQEDIEMLVTRDDYMAAGNHIGMRKHVADMDEFIYFVKMNKLAVINLEKTDARIRQAANMLAEYNPENILLVSKKEPGHKPIDTFAQVTGAQRIYGRFMPGTLTNPNADDFTEPDIVIVVDPVEDQQAVKEAANARIPVIGVCDTGNHTTNIDLVIPSNNKGKKALALLFYLLAQQLQDARGEAFTASMEDFLKEEDRGADEE